MVVCKANRGAERWRTQHAEDDAVDRPNRKGLVVIKSSNYMYAADGQGLYVRVWSRHVLVSKPAGSAQHARGHATRHGMIRGRTGWQRRRAHATACVRETLTHGMPRQSEHTAARQAWVGALAGINVEMSAWRPVCTSSDITKHRQTCHHTRARQVGIGGR